MRARRSGRAALGLGLGLAVTAALALLAGLLFAIPGGGPGEADGGARTAVSRVDGSRRPGIGGVPPSGAVPGGIPAGIPGAAQIAGASSRRAEAAAAAPDQASQVELRVEVVAVGSGAPVEGARFEVRGEGTQPRSPRELVDAASGQAARTGVDGWATLLRNRGSSAAIQVSRDGYQSRRFLPEAEAEAVTVALAPAAALSVVARGFDPGRLVDLRVTPSGVRPRPGTAWERPRTYARLGAGEDGSATYLFRGLEPGTYAVTASQRRGGFDEAFGVLAVAGEVAHVALEPREGESVRGQVVDRDSGRPLQGLRVSLAPSGGGAPRRASREGIAPQVTDGAGRFQIDGAPQGASKLHVQGESRRHLATRDIMVTAGNAPREITVRIPAPCTLRGRVEGHTPGRAPTHVVAVRRGEAHGFFRDLVRRGRRRDLAGVLSRRSHGEVAADGTFAIVDAPAGARPVVIALCDDGRSGARVVETKVEPGDDHGGIVVELEERPKLRVEVLDASGAPEHTARLRVRETFLGRSEWHNVGGGERSGDGVLLTPVLGRFDQARAESLRGDGTNERVIPGQGEVTLTLATGARVTVRVEDDQGIPLTFAKVELRAPRADAVDKKGRPRWRVLASNARDFREAYGTAYFSVDPTLPWSIRVIAQGYEPHEEAVVFGPDGAADHRVALRWAPRVESASVVGRLVRAGNGDRLYGVRFGGIGKAPFRVDGPEFRIDGLDPGERSIVVHSRGFESYALPVASLEPGEVLDVGELRLRAASAVQVKVVDAAGKPLGGARVRLRALPEERGGRPGLPGTIRLEEDRRRLGPGRYRAEGVGRATWRLVVDHKGKRRHRDEIRIMGREEALTVRLADN